MNWNSESSDARRWASDERSDLCEHVERDRSLAFRVLCEDDSFGPVARFVACKQCYDESREEARKVHHICDDCGASVAREGGIMWKWFDFYAPQGDEPLFICLTCEESPTHAKRVERDSADYEREMRMYNRGMDRDDY